MLSNEKYETNVCSGNGISKNGCHDIIISDLLFSMYSMYIASVSCTVIVVCENFLDYFARDKIFQLFIKFIQNKNLILGQDSNLHYNSKQ